MFCLLCFLVIVMTNFFEALWRWLYDRLFYMGGVLRSLLIKSTSMMPLLTTIPQR